MSCVVLVRVSNMFFVPRTWLSHCFHWRVTVAIGVDCGFKIVCVLDGRLMCCVVVQFVGANINVRVPPTAFSDCWFSSI